MTQYIALKIIDQENWEAFLESINMEEPFTISGTYKHAKWLFFRYDESMVNVHKEDTFRIKDSDFLKDSLDDFEWDSKPLQKVKLTSLPPLDVNFKIATDDRVPLEQYIELLKIIPKKEIANTKSANTIARCLAVHDALDVFIEFCNPTFNADIATSLFNSSKATPLPINNLYCIASDCNVEKFMRYCKKFNVPLEKEESPITMPNTVIASQEYITENDCSNPLMRHINDWIELQSAHTYVLKSAYGTGKTSAIRTIAGQFKRVLFVSYRVSLAREMARLFDLDLYKDDDFNPESDKLVIQIDSIFRVKKQKYDLIVLDEIASILSHMGNIMDSELTFNTLMSLITSTPKVFMADGDIDNKSLKFVQHIALKRENPDFSSISYGINTHNKMIYSYTLTPNFDHIKKQVSESLDNGENIVLVCMSKTSADAIERHISSHHKDKSCALYTSSTPKKKLKELENVDAAWVKYNAVIYTSTIESGVSFNVENYFDRILICMQAEDDINYCSTTQRALTQMTSRVRHVKHKEILTFISSIRLPTINTEAIPVAAVRQIYSSVFSASKLTSRAYKDVQFYNIAESLNRSAKVFLFVFIKLVEAKGCTVDQIQSKVQKIPKLANSCTIDQDMTLSTTVYSEDSAQKCEQKNFNRMKFRLQFNTIEDMYYYEKAPYLFNLNYLLSAKTAPPKSIADSEMQSKISIISAIFDTIAHKDWKQNLSEHGCIEVFLPHDYITKDCLNHMFRLKDTSKIFGMEMRSIYADDNKATDEAPTFKTYSVSDFADRKAKLAAIAAKPKKAPSAKTKVMIDTIEDIKEGSRDKTQEQLLAEEAKAKSEAAAREQKHVARKKIIAALSSDEEIKKMEQQFAQEDAIEIQKARDAFDKANAKKFETALTEIPTEAQLAPPEYIKGKMCTRKHFIGTINKFLELFFMKCTAVDRAASERSTHGNRKYVIHIDNHIFNLINNRVAEVMPIEMPLKN